MELLCLHGTLLPSTGCPDRCGLRNGAVTGIFYVYKGHQRLPWDHKGGRNLPLGKKYKFIALMMIQHGGQKNDEI